MAIIDLPPPTVFEKRVNSVAPLTDQHGQYPLYPQDKKVRVIVEDNGSFEFMLKQELRKEKEGR